MSESTDADWHLDSIEYHLECLRGEDPDVRPELFNIPTSDDLRSMRTQLGLSRYETSGMIGFGQSHIQAVEDGSRNPSIRYMVRILRAFHSEWPDEVDDE